MKQSQITNVEGSLFQPNSNNVKQNKTQNVHVSYSHLPRSTCIPYGNYILAHVKIDWGALYGIQSPNVQILAQDHPS